MIPSIAPSNLHGFAGVTLELALSLCTRTRNLPKPHWYITAIPTGKKEFGTPYYPVRALTYYFHHMTEHPEMRKADADCLFLLKITMQAGS